MADVTRDSIYLKIAALTTADLLYEGVDGLTRYGSSAEIDEKIVEFDLMKSQLEYIQENLDSVVTFSAINKEDYNQISYSASSGGVAIVFSFQYKWHMRDNTTAWEHINTWLSEQESILDAMKVYWDTASVPDTDIFD